jgi:dihydroorotate dehydrogenase (NAD+) catalytic subunit
MAGVDVSRPAAGPQTRSRDERAAQETVDLTVPIGGRRLENPVGVASGTFGYGTEYEKLIELNRIGALYTKAVTLEPRAGNDVPRIVETPSGMLNSIGLANVGVDRFVGEKMPFLSTLACAVVANVAGSSADEYLRVVETLEARAPSLWGYEINLSCPNVKEGCMVFGTSPHHVESLTRTLRTLTHKPLVIKLTPNVTDICEIASAAENGGADAVSCINTVLGMIIDTRKKRTVLPGGTGGLSGPAILPIGVAAVYRVTRSVHIPVIGIGGITCADDALQYLLAGASAVQVGTASFSDPSTVRAVLEGVVDYARREGFLTIEAFHTALS